MFKELNETYMDLQEKLVNDNELKQYVIYYDEEKKEFFYIVRVDYDAIITNNNRFKNYLCLWDYEFDCLNTKDIPDIERILNRDGIKFITNGDSQQSCESIIKELERLNRHQSIKQILETT